MTVPGSSVSGASDTQIAVLVATRDRPDRLRTCVESILANDHGSFAVIVVEQSARAAVLPDDPRLTRVRSSSTGKSAALNEGMAMVRAPIIAFTDDDCVVPTDWLRRGEAVLIAHPQVSLVFGDLLPVEHDMSAAFVPVAEFDRFRIVAGRRSAVVRGGAGADMFARRSLFDTIGRYDELIGPGSRFRACEEFDIYYRALAAGAEVAYDPDITVVHDGARPYADGSGQMLKRWYAFGEGAVIAKHLRLHDTGIVRPAAQIIGSDLRSVVKNVSHRRMAGVGVLGYKCWGLLSGLPTGVDRRHRVYRPRRHGAARSSVT
ncbi:MAG: glycosyl transferase family 2 [Ilumatobacteraceae bacterium]|nr:glycosyl transferase family 2 [Ilumatobacteraceae bacterium]